ncbi:universal stress protein [Stenotrophomonas sp. HITSZ_GD]|uniref:universal stress protein n=1 Tax=Stenotrophomonas sp. HITSZ_GD TaxID=3037248 RepID=UPI00240E9139|nr:universal stress protein [Stenotrophomonas sp. HITSZ_GD]MDG2526057.1 universal stress protein [Stenotrophomonas sp. HITSZ_GD]
MSDAIVAPPASLLLATDLSARGDRAFDRAVQLARQWQSRLVVTTVLPSTQELDFHDPILGSPPWQRPAVLSQLVERRLRRDVAVDDIDLEVRVESGAVGPALLRTAQACRCGLIIAGVARNALFTQPSLGSSVAWLSRHATVPLLVVHRRVHGPYRSLAWATDLSDTASQALDVALALFGNPVTLAALHAFQVPRLGQRDTHAQAAQAQARDSADNALRSRLDLLGLPTALRGRLEPVVAEGEPSRLLRDYVRDHDTDLVVVGGHGRSALSGLLLGDVAGRILGSVQTDTLFVRDRGERAAPTA